LARTSPRPNLVPGLRHVQNHSILSSVLESETVSAGIFARKLDVRISIWIDRLASRYSNFRTGISPRIRSRLLGVVVKLLPTLGPAIPIRQRLHRQDPNGVDLIVLIQPGVPPPGSSSSASIHPAR